MRTAVRRLLLLFALTAVAIGPMASGIAAAGAGVGSSLAMRPTDVDLIGSWAGTVQLDGAVEPMDGGIIAIHRTSDDRLAVTVGPDDRVRYSTARLARTDQGLRFEVSLPGEETRLLAYDVTIDRGAMIGTVTFVKYRLTKPARLEFARQ